MEQKSYGSGNINATNSDENNDNSNSEQVKKEDINIIKDESGDITTYHAEISSKDEGFQTSFGEDIDSPNLDDGIHNDHGQANYDDDNSNNQEENFKGNLQDLSPAEKRRSVEKTAEMLLLVFTELVQSGYESMCTVNLEKLASKQLTGFLDLKLNIENEETTVRGYFEAYNLQIKKASKLNPEELIHIKEALVDVLMEQNYAMSSNMRLVVAVFVLILSKGKEALMNIQSKNYAIKEMAKIHADKKEAERLKDENEKLKMEMLMKEISDKQIETETLIKKD